MNYQMHFDPYLIEHLKQRDEELLQEMEALRLQKHDLRHGQVPAVLWRQAAPQEQGMRLQGGRRDPFSA